MVSTDILVVVQEEKQPFDFMQKSRYILGIYEITFSDDNFINYANKWGCESYFLKVIFDGLIFSSKQGNCLCTKRTVSN